MIESTTIVAKSEWRYVAELELDFDWNLPPVPLLRREFSQVLLDLIVNAARAISASLPASQTGKGKLSIRTKLRDKQAEIRVSDSGSPMSEAARARVLEPPSAAADGVPETRRGLANAYSVVVEQLGGSLSCESREGSRHDLRHHVAAGFALRSVG